MTGLGALIRRHTKLYFKDKGMFFTSLITPLILLLLFVTFLGNVYRDSFRSVLAGLTVSDDLLEGFVGGWLVSSLLATSCITVAFCSNLRMVQDKVTGARGDLTVAPVKRGVLALSYAVSSALSTFLICVVTFAVGMVYLWQVGWYLSVQDVLWTLLDVTLLVLFGTALSSVVNIFLSSQGQMSAVGTIVSSCYGFICGAYMPISQFSEGIQTFVSFLPGTYGTVLLRGHLLGGALAQLQTTLPAEAVDALRSGFDLDLYVLDHAVTQGTMYAVLGGAVALLLGVYVVLNVVKGRKQGG